MSIWERWITAIYTPKQQVGLSLPVLTQQTREQVCSGLKEHNLPSTTAEPFLPVLDKVGGVFTCISLSD